MRRRRKTGRFRLSDLQSFAKHWNSQGKDTQPYELQSTIHSVCIAQFWRAIESDEGLNQATSWCAPGCRILLAIMRFQLSRQRINICEQSKWQAFVSIRCTACQTDWAHPIQYHMSKAGLSETAVHVRTQWNALSAELAVV